MLHSKSENSCINRTEQNIIKEHGIIGICQRKYSYGNSNFPIPKIRRKYLANKKKNKQIKFKKKKNACWKLAFFKLFINFRNPIEILLSFFVGVPSTNFHPKHECCMLPHSGCNWKKRRRRKMKRNVKTFQRHKKNVVA